MPAILLASALALSAFADSAHANVNCKFGPGDAGMWQVNRHVTVRESDANGMEYPVVEFTILADCWEADPTLSTTPQPVSVTGVAPIAHAPLIRRYIQTDFGRRESHEWNSPLLIGYTEPGATQESPTRIQAKVRYGRVRDVHSTTPYEGVFILGDKIYLKASLKTYYLSSAIQYFVPTCAVNNSVALITLGDLNADNLAAETSPRRTVQIPWSGCNTSPTELGSNGQIQNTVKVQVLAQGIAESTHGSLFAIDPASDASGIALAIDLDSSSVEPGTGVRVDSSRGKIEVGVRAVKTGTIKPGPFEAHITLQFSYL